MTSHRNPREDGNVTSDTVCHQDDAQISVAALISSAHHAQPGVVRFADALQALQREGAHVISGKSFTDFASAEFRLPPAMIDALVKLPPEHEAHER
jgi:hypothetical protein